MNNEGAVRPTHKTEFKAASAMYVIAVRVFHFVATRVLAAKRARPPTLFHVHFHVLSVLLNQFLRCPSALLIFAAVSQVRAKHALAAEPMPLPALQIVNIIFRFAKHPFLTASMAALIDAGVGHRQTIHDPVKDFLGEACLQDFDVLCAGSEVETTAWLWTCQASQVPALHTILKSPLQA